MDLSVQKSISAQLLKCSLKRVKFDPERLDEVKEAITKADIKSLVNDRAIVKVQKNNTSKDKVRKRKSQKVKGKRKGHGKRKGKATARDPKKSRWMNKIRSQRELLKNLKIKGSINQNSYRNLYVKSKSGFFRSKRHLLLYIDEHKLKIE